MNRLSLFLIACFLCGAGYANNISVTNIVLTDQNAESGETTVQFDLSWENSWRISVGPANYDAAWVFVKYRVGGGGWQHASLSRAGALPVGGTVEAVDNVGAFVYRSGDGSGAVDFREVQLVWDYGIAGIDPNAVVDVQVFALEMVYVPQGAFSLGTGATIFTLEDNENSEFYQVEGSSLSRPPYPVTSEGAITVASTPGNLYYAAAAGVTQPGDQSGPIPAAFPKGYADFYSAKYETTQAQFVAFFNTLTQNQREYLDPTGPRGKGTDDESVRNSISWFETGNATTAHPDVALNFIANPLMLAYLDWAGLRPMTELEYEKAGRGTADPVDDEFAWGTSSIYAFQYALIQEGQPNEAIADPATGTGNAQYGATNATPGGPRRVGIFAASAINANREETGGSYYGIMELTGNLYERVISVGLPEGRAFNGSHGDGRITAAGFQDVISWPLDNEGIGYRGGSWTNGVGVLRLSDRTDAASVLVGANTRIGFRGVRTAN